MRAGDELHRTALWNDWLKRDPNSELVVFKVRIPKRLVLMPRRGCAAFRLFQDRQIEEAARVVTKQLACDAERVSKALRFVQLRDVVHWIQNLWRAEHIRMIGACNEVRESSFFFTGAPFEELLQTSTNRVYFLLIS